MSFDEERLPLVAPSRAADALVKALRRIGTPEALKSVAAWEQRVALYRATPFSAVGGIETIRFGLHHAQPFIRHYSLRQLIESKDAQYIPEILSMVDDPDWEICKMAVRMLAHWRDPQIPKKLGQRLFEIEHFPTAQTTIQVILSTLTRIATDDAVHILQQWQQTHPGDWN